MPLRPAPHARGPPLDRLSGGPPGFRPATIAFGRLIVMSLMFSAQECEAHRKRTVGNRTGELQILTFKRVGYFVTIGYS